MKCPSEQLVIAAALGELDASEATAVGQHICECESCSDLMHAHCELRTLLTPAGQIADEVVFARSVMGRCSEARARAIPPYRRVWVYGSAAIAAAAVLWLSRPRTHSDLDVVAARGTSSSVSMPVTPDVLLVRGKTLLPIQDAELHPGDGITVRYWNPSDEPVYLTAFALDSAATVHWIYPAYLDESENPQSIRLERSVEGKLMTDAVEPEAPVTGRLRIVTLLTPDPLTVREVEAQVARGTQNLKLTFPTARVHEWNCTWNAD